MYFHFMKNAGLFYLCSVRYKEVTDDGMPPVIGSIYVQKRFAVESKNIELVITKKLNKHYGKAGSTIDIVF
jgi:hypothetical protein